MKPINPETGPAASALDIASADKDVGPAPMDTAGRDGPAEVAEQVARRLDPGWDQYIRDAVEIEWCTGRSYGPQLDEKAFYKRQAADRGLIDGRIEVRLDATIAGVDVPKRFRSMRSLCLAMTLNDPVDTTTDDVGIRATLSFQGARYACVLPWAAIWSIATERGVSCWREDMPPEVLAELEKPAAKCEPEPPKVYVPHPVIGPAVDRLMAGVGAAYAAHKQAQMDEWERAEAAEAAEPLPIASGAVFRFTAAFLRSAVGFSRAPDERWTAVACECGLCASGRFVAIDTGRHFARSNIERCPFAVGRSEHVSDAESDEFLAAERKQLGVDRLARTVRPWT